MTRITVSLYALALAGGIALVSAHVFFDFEGAKAAAPTPVLVANRFIPAGTPGTCVLGREMSTRTTLPRREVEVGAIADPEYVWERVVTTDLFPGNQLTTASFRPNARPTSAAGPPRCPVEPYERVPRRTGTVLR